MRNRHRSHASVFVTSLALTALLFSLSALKTSRLSIQANQTERKITLQAAGRGNPWISLRDGRDVPTTYSGAPELATTIEQNFAQPLVLAASDFDGDGVPDLVSGYAGAGGGVLCLHRGRIDLLSQSSPEARQFQQQAASAGSGGAGSEDLPAPFLPVAQVFGVPEIPDFLRAGDFDGDGHSDVVTAARGSKALYFLPGDGQGGLGQAQRLEMPGEVTVLATGETTLADRTVSAMVGIIGEKGPQVLLFEGAEEVFKSEPQAIDLPAKATAMALGQLDSDQLADLAIAAGTELVIVAGLGRKLSFSSSLSTDIKQAQAPQTKISRHSQPFTIAALAAGNFTSGGQQELVLLSEHGAIHLLEREKAAIRQAEPSASWREKVKINIPGLRINSVDASGNLLIPAQASSLPGEDLVVVDQINHQLHILHLTNGGQPVQTGQSAAGQIVTLDVEGEPVAALAMRLNVDALSDLVVLKSGPNGLTIALTVAAASFAVNSTADDDDAIAEDNQCSICLKDQAGRCLLDQQTGRPIPGGPCTLRAAIQQANANPGADAITFLPTITSIHPQRALPPITGMATIDGTLPGGGRVELNGAGVGGNGLSIAAANSVVRRLVINRFGGSGISVTASSVFIQDNFIGTDVSGTKISGNLGFGVSISGSSSNTIGGTTPATRNLISGNGDRSGIGFSGGGIIIFGNSAMGNRVQGNFIGTDVNGASALGNLGTGVAIWAPNNIIGGATSTPGTLQGNVISGNGGGGIIINSSNATGNQIQGNLIGVNKDATAALSNSTGIYIYGAVANLIGGTSAATRNLISGNSQGISISNRATGNQVRGNFIGTNLTGTAALGNSNFGIVISDSSFDNVIGGTIGTTPSGSCSGSCNLISGNGSQGLMIAANSNNNQVQGNYIGTNLSGSAAIGNADVGVLIISSASNNLIGGATAAARNLISGNGAQGVKISKIGTTGNRIQGNFIGTDVSSIKALPNFSDGVLINSASNNTVGGTASGMGNTIAFNGGAGVAVLESSTGNAILSNSIFSNRFLGIDLNDDGVSPNDPKDPDLGPNDLQNCPVITMVAGGAIQGTLNSKPNTSFRLEFFSNSTCNSCDHVEGEKFIGSMTVTTDCDGNAKFTTPLQGQSITATATDSNNNTSEFFQLDVEVLDPVCDSANIPTDTCGSPIRLSADCPGSFLKVVGNSEVVIDPTPSRLAMANVKRVGAVTDGVTMLLLRVRSDTPVTFSLSPRGVASPDKSYGELMKLDRSAKGSLITVAPEETDSPLGKVAFAAYKTPIDFPSDSASNPVEIIIEAKTSSKTGRALLTLRPPAVVLVHGTWSDGTAWQGLGTFLENKFGLNTWFVDYSDQMWNGSILPGTKAIIGSLTQVTERARKSIRGSGIAITQVDVIAHSLGGLVVRSRASELLYRRPDNYWKGDFHKIITVGSTHLGTPLADWLLNNKCKSTSLRVSGVQFRVRVEDLMARAKHPIGQVIYDQQTESLAIEKIGPTAVPSHAIVGIKPSVRTATEFFLENVLKYVDRSETLDKIFKGETHDIIVPTRSQRGNLIGTAQQEAPNVLHASLLPPDKDKDETHSKDIWDRIATLLLKREINTSFFGNFPGFIRPNVMEPISFSPCSSSSSALALASSAATTLTPIQGAVIHPGNSINIVFTITGGNTVDGAFIGVDGLFHQIDGPGPFSLSYEVPSERAGKVDVVAFTYGPGPDNYLDTTYFIVSPSLPPLSISASPGQLLLDRLDEQAQFRITGQFPDGKQIDLTSSSAGTSYSVQSGSTAVISVTPEGLVEARGIGQATILIANSGKTTTVPVIVRADNPAPTITNLSPNSIAASGASFALTINGANFSRDSTVYWNDALRPATFISPTQLITVIPAADIAAPGTANVTVFNPIPGGGTTTAIFTVTQAGDRTQIEISPASPSTNDQISIKLSGVWPNTCVPRDPMPSVVGNEVRINTSNPGQFCGQAFTPWSLTASIGRLPAGAFRVIAAHSFPGGQSELGQKTFTVTQASPACSYSFFTPLEPYPASGGAGSVDVSTQNGCNWTASSEANWITISSGSSGSGRGTVNFLLAANNTPNIRYGTLRIADRAITLSQLGASCPMVASLSPTSGSIGSAVTITGNNFTGANTVRFFNNLSAISTINSNTQITATVPNGAATGPITISKAGCSDVQTSTFTVVNSPPGYTLIASPGTVAAGGELTINWTAPSGQFPLDWIGLFKVGAPNTSYDSARWGYTNGATSGRFSFSAPAEPGQYEFRYLLNNGFTDVAHSNVVTVSANQSFTLTVSPSTAAPGSQLMVCWTAPGGRPSTDWLGLYRVSDGNRDYSWWRYTNGATSGCYTLTAPSQPGQYHFRYLLNNDYTDQTHSPVVTVQ